MGRTFPFFCNLVQDSSASFLQLGTIKFQRDASISLQREGELFPLFFAIRCKKSDASTSFAKEGGLLPLFFTIRRKNIFAKGGGNSPPSFLQLGAIKFQRDASKSSQREGELFPLFFAIRCKKKLCIYIFAKEFGLFPLFFYN